MGVKGYPNELYFELPEGLKVRKLALQSLLAADEKGVTFSVFIEPVKGMKSALDCRRFYGMKLLHRAKEGGTKTRPWLEYHIKEYQGMKVEQRHRHVYLWDSGLCADLHTSIVSYREEQEPLLMTAARFDARAKRAPGMEELLEAAMLAQRRQYPAAAAIYEKVLSAPPAGMGKIDLGMAYRGWGGVAISMDDGPTTAMAYGKAKQLLGETDFLIEFNLACAYSLMGQLDRSESALREAIRLADLRSPEQGARYRQNSQTDPQLAALRKSPAFASIIAP